MIHPLCGGQSADVSDLPAIMQCRFGQQAYYSIVYTVSYRSMGRITPRTTRALKGLRCGKLEYLPGVVFDDVN